MGSNPGLDGERSVGVSSDDVTEAGEKSGELGDVSKLRAGFFVNGAGELRFSVRSSCSTCYYAGQPLLHGPKAQHTVLSKS